MKKFLMIAVMAVAALTANAQQGEYYVTPKIDLGYTSIHNLNDAKSGIIGGVGVDFEYMVADQFGVGAGVDFQYMESEKVNGYKLKYSHVAIPVVGKYHIGQFAIKAGIQPTFKTSCKLDYEGQEANASEATKSFTLYVPVGVSYTFNTPIELGLNVAIPCTGIGKNVSESDNTKIMPIYLSVGYRF